MQMKDAEAQDFLMPCKCSGDQTDLTLYASSVSIHCRGCGARVKFAFEAIPPKVLAALADKLGLPLKTDKPLKAKV